jgi:hypothetical protein
MAVVMSLREFIRPQLGRFAPKSPGSLEPLGDVGMNHPSRWIHATGKCSCFGLTDNLHCAHGFFCAIYLWIWVGDLLARGAAGIFAATAKRSQGM